jgi:hypothetical protein
MAEFEGIEVAFPTKVKVAVSESEIFSDFVSCFVEGEGRGLGLVVDCDVIGKEFDRPGIEVRVFRPFVTIADFSANLDHTLGFEFGEKFGKSLVLRIKNYLCLALPVA